MSDATLPERTKAGHRKAALLAAVTWGAFLWVPSATQAEPEPERQAAVSQAEAVDQLSRVLMLEAERKETAEELAALSGTISMTEAGIKSLDAEIAALAADRDRIREAMIAAAAEQKTIERDIAATELRIDGLAVEEATLKSSLRARRGLLAEVLGALQRMGRKPPPALLVRPDDALGSVRSAILLGAVVPRIRTETDKLVVDLDKLASVKRDIDSEKLRFVEGMTRQKSEEARLARLFSEKEKLEAGSRERRRAESERAAELAAEATSLEGLIAALETEAASERAAEEAARRVAEAEAEAKVQAEIARVAEARRLAAEQAEQAEQRRIAEAEAESRRIAALEIEAERIAALKTEAERVAALKRAEEQRVAAKAEADRLATAEAERVRLAAISNAEGKRVAALQREEEAIREASAAPDGTGAQGPRDAGKTYDVASLRRDMTRLEAGAAFSTMKGRLSTPVSGAVRISYGKGDGIGRPASGVTFAARAGDLVTAPGDGQVLYSGPFRSYGQLLILDAGDGYHVVLAGMSDIDVDVGQFVLSGEPVAVMGAKRLASAAGADFGAADPSLYVEFRKDGKPVDPSPWWAEKPSGRTRNDS